MKTLIVIWVAATLSVPLYGQHLTDNQSHLYRTGDETPLLRVNHFHVGEAGDSVVWDYSDIGTEDNGNRITYTSDSGNDSVITAVAGEIRLYYKQDSLAIRLAGYETSLMEVEYNVPQVVVPLPLNRRKSVSGTFHGSAMYCENLMMRHFGTYSTEVDAKGKMFLPGGLALDDVHRVHCTYNICNIVYDSIHTKSELTKYIREKKPMPEDSIKAYTIAHRDEMRHIEKYLWYADGYRYPIIQSIFCRKKDTDRELTTLYCPPTEQEKMYDPENEKIRKGMKNGKNARGQSYENTNPKGEGPVFPTYNIKVTGDVITILFDDNAGNATTRAILSDISSIVYRIVSGKSGSPLSIDCRGLRSGEYTVRLSYDGMTTESIVHLRNTTN